MGFKARRAVPDETVFLTVPIPGWLKNELLDLCEKKDVSLQRLVGLLLVNGIRDADGRNALGFDKPSEPMNGVVAYLRGERRLEPCGQPSCVKKPVEVLGSSYCDTCGVCLA